MPADPDNATPPVPPTYAPAPPARADRWRVRFGFAVLLILLPSAPLIALIVWAAVSSFR